MGIGSIAISFREEGLLLDEGHSTWLSGLYTR